MKAEKYVVAYDSILRDVTIIFGKGKIIASTVRLPLSVAINLGYELVHILDKTSEDNPDSNSRPTNHPSE
jgi:hypothetical protein